MKKFLSVMLLVATIHYIYAEKQEPFFLKDGDQLLLCDINKEGDEECCPFDIEALKKINNLIVENEKKAKELTKNIMNAQVRYRFITLQTNPYLTNLPNNNWQKRFQKSTAEERKTIEALTHAPACLRAPACLIPQALINYLKNGKNGIKKSMLSAEEQVMYDKIEEMNEKLNKNEKQK